MNGKLEIRILNYLNDRYNPSTTIKCINSISMIDGYYRVEANIIEHFTSGIHFTDTSIFFIDKEEV